MSSICDKIGLIGVDEEMTMLKILGTLGFYNTEAKKSVFEVLDAKGIEKDFLSNWWFGWFKKCRVRVDWGGFWF